MAKEVTCPPCGEIITGETDDELVEKVQAHAKTDHGSDLTAEHILAHARSV